ncbi:thioredoxin-like protein [Myxozyma melibiosi]|uniref:protein disulfide-isomerase n=1 Tax=Myxozyma melibiosi TaxID=54550 RepID=A0ABR1FDY0_9ASCO
MRFFGSILTVLATAAVAVTASNVIEVNDKDFDKVVLNSGVPSLVEFYATWCGHCKNTAPIYEQLADSYESKKDKIQIVKIDGDRNRKAAKKYGIEGFPTFKFFDGKGSDPINYEKGRSLEQFQDFISENTGMKSPKPKAPPSAVTMLDDRNFKKLALDPNKDVLVAFTASWCGHCKAMAPAYEQAAGVFAGDKDVIIAKVDCTAPEARSISEEFEIKGYPTIKFFPKGSDSPVDYQFGRSLEDFVSFVNSHAGTHRTLDGSLDDTIGLLEEFDSVIALLKDDATKAIEKAKEVANSSSIPYAAYYGKVVEKVANQGEQYLEKEITRLENILKKGTMNRGNTDQFQIRKNILADVLEKYKSPAGSHIQDEL